MTVRGGRGEVCRSPYRINISQCGDTPVVRQVWVMSEMRGARERSPPDPPVPATPSNRRVASTIEFINSGATAAGDPLITQRRSIFTLWCEALAHKEASGERLGDVTCRDVTWSQVHTLCTVRTSHHTTPRTLPPPPATRPFVCATSDG